MSSPRLPWGCAGLVLLGLSASVVACESSSEPAYFIIYGEDTDERDTSDESDASDAPLGELTDLELSDGSERQDVLVIPGDQAGSDEGQFPDVPSSEIVDDAGPENSDIPPRPAALCGDGLCEASESTQSCPEDCGSACGDTACNGPEDRQSCPEDCFASCGDGVCNGDESPGSCAMDCGDLCGDARCTGAEASLSCPEDCGALCGDLVCNGPESSASCPLDCGVVCGDASCHATESAGSCPADCTAVCGDTVCTDGESPASCPADCGVSCGDGVCVLQETAQSCAADCDGCGNGDCTHGENSATCEADCPPQCGDGLCAAGESGSSCPIDCGSLCDDGTCNGGEHSQTCPQDCGSQCGDGVCNGPELAANCPVDCGVLCGDGSCNGGENSVSCGADCGAQCGDGVCHHDEASGGCEVDCGPLCGDGSCEGVESSATCPGDCGSLCGDGVCNGGEEPSECPSDCESVCGDAMCTGDEQSTTCPQDCGALCGDGVCNGGEDSAQCVEDCDAFCGDGVCNGDEGLANCPDDCDGVCGDGFCVGAEAASTCPEDCPLVTSTCWQAEDGVVCAGKRDDPPQQPCGAMLCDLDVLPGHAVLDPPVWTRNDGSYHSGCRACPKRCGNAPKEFVDWDATWANGEQGCLTAPWGGNYRSIHHCCAEHPEAPQCAGVDLDTSPEAQVAAYPCCCEPRQSDSWVPADWAGWISENPFWVPQVALSPIADLLSAFDYATLMPHADYGVGLLGAKEATFFSYENLLRAGRYVPEFAASGDVSERKRELAAFLAQASQETNGMGPDDAYAWGFVWNCEVGCCPPNPPCTQYDANPCDLPLCPELYVQRSVQYTSTSGKRANEYIDDNGIPQLCNPWPCAEGQHYYGRGAKQLTHAFNYGAASLTALGDTRLLQQPDILSTDGVLAFVASLWFYMTPQSPKPSCHEVLMGTWQPSAEDISLGRGNTFGMCTTIVNGGIECGGGDEEHPAAVHRAEYFKVYCDYLGVDSGPEADLMCGHITPY